MPRFNPFANNNSGDEPAVKAVTLSPQPTPPAPSAADFEQQRAAEAERQRRSEEIERLCVELYGQPGQPKVKVDHGMMAVTLSLKFDNSDSMTDYFDRHHGFSPAFAVLIVKKQAEKEALARRALETAVRAFPSLQSLRWEWKTEKWSMGHGNYLESATFDYPTQLQGLKDVYRGPKVFYGHWEIEFNRPYLNDRPLELWPLKSGAPVTPSGQSSDQIQAITLLFNESKDGIEIHFPGKPAAAILAEIHELNKPAKIWRYHFTKKFWYARNTPENKAWAEAFMSRHTGISETQKPIEIISETQAAPPVAVIPIAVETQPEPMNLIEVQFKSTVTAALPVWRRRFMR